MSISINGQSSVPPGFRFHPTEEELLDYYLRKKVASEPIDLDVIREIDLNKLEPWEIQEKCTIGTTHQNHWYFFGHKDKKYPTGTRTNRATAAGFWKATGRDKVINTSLKRIGLRKTLVFYAGRAPQGWKSDWIMHEYRLDELYFTSMAETLAQESSNQEEGWVVCRMFRKKNFLHKSSGTSTCSSSNFKAITNDGSLDKIVQRVGRSDQQQSCKNMGAGASRKPLYSERYVKLPALEGHLPQESRNATVIYDCDNDASLPLCDWATLDKLIAFQLDGQFEAKEIMWLDDAATESIDKEEETSGNGDLWGLASWASDRM